eukprot:4294444-Amphidinium_carterae.1
MGGLSCGALALGDLPRGGGLMARVDDTSVLTGGATGTRGAVVSAGGASCCVLAASELNAIVMESALGIIDAMRDLLVGVC